MRIISGIAKSRKIIMDSKLDIRPVSDRVKQSMFEILKYNILGSVVLDLFAGTGSLGLEAVSRGATEAVFVEKDLKCIKLIKNNIKNLRFDNNCRVMVGDVNKVIEDLWEKNCLFDMIILDPPYLKDLIRKTLKNLVNNDILNDKGIIIVKHHKKEPVIKEDITSYVIDERHYGDTVLSFLMKRKGCKEINAKNAKE